ncbi:MAG: L-lactate permease [Iphinoe sp. HA4291-MV1]|jgi:lactate permease|nr:L-lactate permease [Iphinoe sp. HA4291-MV1]
MEWIQVYDPAGNAILSTVLAALPIVVLLGLLAIFKIAAQWAALAGLVTAFIVSVLFYGMPFNSAVAAVGFGAAYALLPIGWIILAAVFLYEITLETRQFEVVKNSIASLTSDRRIQALLICFSFGAFLEGAAGFGTPVAICAALLTGLGFPSLHAAGLCLIANTAPVAFGAIGIPILTLSTITQQEPFILGQMAGRQLPFVSLIIPVWLVMTMSGWKGLKGVWPVVLVSGSSFAIVQFFWSNFVGPELVDIAGGLISLVVTAAFAALWKPADNWDFSQEQLQPNPTLKYRFSFDQLIRAWMPWVFMCLFVLTWGLPQSKAFLSGSIENFKTYQSTAKPGLSSQILAPSIQVPSLHNLIYRDYPVVSTKVDVNQVKNLVYKSKYAESAVYTLNWLSATGTSIFIAALVTAVYLRVQLSTLLKIAGRTFKRMRWPLFTIACMLALGYLTHYSGTDATLGLTFTKTGVLYPFFSAILGWLGVALTGSDTSSNVLFGSLQKITAQQLGFNSILIITANSTGGVMGKMIDVQSIVVSTAATNQSGQERAILQFVFWHSVALVCIMGAIVMLQAYVFPWIIPATQ